MTPAVLLHFFGFRGEICRMTGADLSHDWRKRKKCNKRKAPSGKGLCGVSKKPFSDTLLRVCQSASLAVAPAKKTRNSAGGRAGA